MVSGKFAEGGGVLWTIPETQFAGKFETDGRLNLEM
jgi:hypothetical protein